MAVEGVIYTLFMLILTVLLLRHASIVTCSNHHKGLEQLSSQFSDGLKD